MNDWEKALTAETKRIIRRLLGDLPHTPDGELAGQRVRVSITPVPDEQMELTVTLKRIKKYET